MTRILVVLFIALTFESIGVVLLKQGLTRLEPPKNYGILEIARLIGRGAMSRDIVLGVFFEALFFAGLLYLMSQGDLSFIWPLTALTFVFATFAARFYLHEEIAPLRWMGVGLIVLGAGLITYTEKKSETARAAQVEKPETGLTAGRR